MNLLFLHGLESKPGGRKSQFLKSCGHLVINPALPRETFEISKKIAQDAIDFSDTKVDVIVGSSRGGAVGMSVATREAGLVLVAPAWKKYMNTSDLKNWSSRVDPSNTIILHSENDSIVPFQDSQELADSYGIKLVNVGQCHRMNDDDALEALADVTKWLKKS